MSKFSVEDFLIEVNAKGKDMTDDEYDEYFSSRLEELSEKDYNAVIDALKRFGDDECGCEENDEIKELDAKEKELDIADKELDLLLKQSDVEYEINRFNNLIPQPYVLENEEIIDNELLREGMAEVQVFLSMFKGLCKEGCDMQTAGTLANNFITHKHNESLAKIQSVQMQNQQI